MDEYAEDFYNQVRNAIYEELAGELLEEIQTDVEKMSEILDKQGEELQEIKAQLKLIGEALIK